LNFDPNTEHLVGNGFSRRRRVGVLVTTWKNIGLGIMFMPERQQAGIIFLIWSVIFVWGEWLAVDSISEAKK
jgi:hypothetical protein